MNVRDKINHMTIDNMVVNLINDCYGIEYADVASHFYQLALQTLETEPNIMGPNKVPTGQSIRNKLTGGYIQVTKKTDEAQPNTTSIWVVRGFYPGTGIPFKLVVYKNNDMRWGNAYQMAGAKVSMGKFGTNSEKALVNISQIKKYTEEVTDKIILDQSLEDIEKPENYYEKTFRTMTPKGLSKQTKTSKNERKKRTNTKSSTKRAKKNRADAIEDPL